MWDLGDKPIVFKKMSPFQSFTKNPPDVSHFDLKSQSVEISWRYSIFKSGIFSKRREFSEKLGRIASAKIVS